MLSADLGDCGQLFSRKDLSRRVVRGVDDDDLGLIRESGAVRTDRLISLSLLGKPVHETLR